MLRKSLLLLAVTVACRGESKIPDTPASLTGRLTVMQQSGDGNVTVRVEANPEDVARTATQAVIRITPTTTIVAPKGEGDGFSALHPGQWVRVWFVGPVLQSQPLQASAGTIVIDSTAGRRR